MTNPKGTAQRFWEKVDKDGECWEWTAYRMPSGYGQFGIGKKLYLAHRVAYELVHGCHIPDGMFACHTCDNPSCVNPSHIFLGTHKDNMSDCKAKGRNRFVVGAESKSAKLTKEQVESIRTLYRREHELVRRNIWRSNADELGRQFGVTHQYVSQLARHQWRKHDAI